MPGKGPDSLPVLPAELASSLRTDALRRAERDDSFWMRQRSQIRSRISRRPLPRRQPMRIAVAGALVLFIAVLLTSPAGQHPSPPPRVAADADQQLLVAVEHALAAGTPEALEPLTLLVVSSSNSNDVEPISHKEQHHED